MELISYISLYQLHVYIRLKDHIYRYISTTCISLYTYYAYLYIRIAISIDIIKYLAIYIILYLAMSRYIPSYTPSTAVHAAGSCRRQCPAPRPTVGPRGKPSRASDSAGTICIYIYSIDSVYSVDSVGVDSIESIEYILYR